MGHRAAIYCRVSTADQSCERQEFDLRAFAGCAGYDVVGIFKETGSGTKLDRAERKKVLALAQSRQIDAILVTDNRLCAPADTGVIRAAQRNIHQCKNGINKTLCSPQGQPEYAFNHQNGGDGEIRIALRSSP